MLYPTRGELVRAGLAALDALDKAGTKHGYFDVNDSHVVVELEGPGGCVVLVTIYPISFTRRYIIPTNLLRGVMYVDGEFKTVEEDKAEYIMFAEVRFVSIHSGRS